MPRDNNGNYAPPVNSWNPAGPNGALAAPADFDALRTDMANEIGNSLDRSGRGGMLCRSAYEQQPSPVARAAPGQWERVEVGAIDERQRYCIFSNAAYSS